MTDADISNRFDQLRGYVDSAVMAPSAARADGQPDPVVGARVWAGWRRVLLPALSAVIVLIVALALALATKDRPAHHPAATTVPAVPATVPATVVPDVVLSCPTAPPAASSPKQSYPLPPAGPHPLTVTDRLVPTITPTHAVVCEYVHPNSQKLTGSRIIDTDLATVPAALGFDPPDASERACTDELRPTDGDTYLIGLTYPTGTLWISAPDDHCLGASNGRFTTSNHVAVAAIQAYSAGTWASAMASGKANGCQPGSGRLGQQSAMVPGTPDQLVVCRDNGAHPVATERATELAAIVAELNRLPTSADSFASKCAGAGVPTVSYALIFSYSAGPPVTVNVYAGCSPAIHNGNLQATNAATVLATLQRIVKH